MLRAIPVENNYQSPGALRFNYLSGNATASLKLLGGWALIRCTKALLIPWYVLGDAGDYTESRWTSQRAQNRREGVTVSIHITDLHDVRLLVDTR